MRPEDDPDDRPDDHARHDRRRWHGPRGRRTRCGRPAARRLDRASHGGCRPGRCGGGDDLDPRRGPGRRRRRSGHPHDARSRSSRATTIATGGRPVLTGYDLSNSVQVTVRDLAALGGVIDGSLQAGATSMDSLVVPPRRPDRGRTGRPTRGGRPGAIAGGRARRGGRGRDRGRRGHRRGRRTRSRLPAAEGGPDDAGRLGDAGPGAARPRSASR